MSDSPLEGIIETLGLGLYRENAFHILGVPTSTSMRRLKRSMDRIQLEEKLNHQYDDGEPKAKTNNIRAREAIERLKNPYCRLVDEVFWFWGNSKSEVWPDEPVQNALKGEFEKAEEIWKEGMQSGDGLALHNLAVLHHMAALEVESSYPSEVSEPKKRLELEYHWQQAYWYWNKLIKEESFWNRLQERVDMVDDPRLNGSINILKSCLPVAILLISGRLVIQSIQTGNDDGSRRHMQRINNAASIGPDQQKIQSIFGDSVQKRAKEIAIEPARERLEVVIERIRPDSHGHPDEIYDLIQKTLKNQQLKQDLLILDTFYGAEHPSSTHYHDEVAKVLTFAIMTYVHRKEAWWEVSGLIEKAIPIAASKNQKERMREEKRKATANANSPFRWVVPGYFDLPDEVLEELEAARAFIDVLDFDSAIRKCEAAYARWKGHSEIIAKPYSMCLYGRAMQLFGETSRLVSRGARFLTSSQRYAVIANIGKIEKDLARARELDPENATIQKEYEAISRLKKDIGAGHTRKRSSSTYRDKPLSQRASGGSSSSTRARYSARSGKRGTGWLNLPVIGAIVFSIVCLLGAFGNTTTSSSRASSRSNPTSTRRIPTMSPTRTPSTTSRLPSNCIRWDRVNDTHINRTICMYGIVREVIPGNGVFTVTFGDDWTDTKVQDYNYRWLDLAPGYCVEVHGRVRDNVSYLFISPDFENPELYYYSSPAACR